LLPPFGIPEWKIPALGGEEAGLFVVVTYGECNGLDATVVAKVGPEASVASDREVGGVAVLHDDKAGLAVAVETVGISQELACDIAIDPELAIRDHLNVVLPPL